jgi:hypothetical protein
MPIKDRLDSIVRGICTLADETSNLNRTVRSIDGVKFLPVELHHDERGELGVLESGRHFGFDVKRVFYIKVETSDSVRGGHATSAAEVILALTGAVTIDVDNGAERATVSLTDTTIALYIGPGVWLRLRNFIRGTVLMVLASQAYADTIYYDAPRPDLITPT